MSFWDRLRNLFRSSPPPAPGRVPVSREHTLPTLEKEIPVKPKQTKDPLFGLNKHIATMLNSISLSSDMKTLYLIDGGRAIAFDLTKPEGVIVGVLGGQLVVASGLGTPEDQQTPDLEGELTAGLRAMPDDGKTTYKLEPKSQYTVTYNEDTEVMAVIGVTDITVLLEDDHQTPTNLDEVAFDLKALQFVKLQYSDQVLQVEQVLKKQL